MTKELRKDAVALLRDFELFKTGTAKALPILDRDITFLKALIKSIDYSIAF